MNTLRKSAPMWLVALGVILGFFGTRLLDSSTAEAQTGNQFGECMALSLYGHDGAAFSNPSWQPRTIRIRSGWRVVGGTQAGGVPHALVCR